MSDLKKISDTRGLFIQVDGIDGAGKSTLIHAALDWVRARNRIVFDVIEWSKTHQCLPRLEDVQDAHVLLTAEPTHAWIGRAIRDEIIAIGTAYGSRSAAQAFALDRLVQYTRLIRPFLDGHPDRMVIQDRGLISSLAYQPLQSEIEQDADRVTIPWLLRLDGNQVALDIPPDAFVFLDVNPSVAEQRLTGREEKLDRVRFENPLFQTVLAKRYHLPEVTMPFTERGTRVIVIDGNNDKSAVAHAMTALLERLAGSQ
jgi:thymidylate kinase